MAGQQTALKRTGSSKFSGMLLTKSIQSGWKTPTFLGRFMEKNGANTTFCATGEAFKQFQTLEPLRIYDMTINASCIQKAKGVAKYGSRCLYEVVLKFQCADLVLSKSCWPLQIVYDFCNWETLDQTAADSHIDLIGIVLKDPVRDASTVLPKLVLQLGNEDYKQDVEFLGEHAHRRFRKGDVIALGGLKIHAYREQRTLQTAFLTAIEVNPKEREHLKSPTVSNEGGTKRKALRLTKTNVLSVAEAKDLLQKASCTGDSTLSVDAQQFTLVGKLSKFDATFFSNDAPILVVKDRNVMCVNSKLEDSTGSVDVKMWDSACQEILGVNVVDLRELWEKGVDDPDQEADILAKLNERFERACDCACSVNTWTRIEKNSKETRIEATINVNAIEIQDEETDMKSAKKSRGTDADSSPSKLNEDTEEEIIVS